MKKNGFTLVEILAVLVLVAAIAIISIPSIINYINQSKNEISNVTEQLIFSGVDLYTDKYSDDFKSGFGHQQCVTLNQVVNEGLLEAPIIDSVSGNEIDLNKYVKINYEYDNNLQIYKTKYEFADECVVQNFMCLAATEDNKTDVGNIPTSGVYNPGDEYKCDLGDGEIRTFYLIEDGDSEGSISGSGKVALILNQNLDNETYIWCKSGSTDDDCEDNNVYEVLANKTSQWMVEVDLPDEKMLTGEMPSSGWILANLDNDSSTETPYGYWLKPTWSGYVEVIDYDNHYYYRYPSSESDVGIRPAITIDKTKLSNYNG